MNMDPEPMSADFATRPDVLQNEREVVRSAGRQAISTFLEGHNCFSVLRASGKVVVFDVNIPIQLAFYALVEHGEFPLSLSVCLSVTCGLSTQVVCAISRHSSVLVVALCVFVLRVVLVLVCAQICRWHRYGIPFCVSLWGS